MILRQKS